MIYKNMTPTKKMTQRKISFGSFKNGINSEYDEHLLPINYSKNTYNLNFLNGALTEGLGVTDVVLYPSKTNWNLAKSFTYPAHTNILATWNYNFYTEFREYDLRILVIYCSNKKVYYNIINGMDTEFIEVVGLTFDSVPKVVWHNHNGLDSLIFSTPENGVWIWAFNRSPQYVSDAPPLTSMAVHYERLFAAVNSEPNQVWFSDDLDITNWSISLNEAGFIQMNDDRGMINKVVSLNDYVYVFREFGISRITAYGDQSQFNVTQIYFSGNRIYENTVVACGNKVFFMAQDGVYYFDGINVTKIRLNLDGILSPNLKSVGNYHNGKYYLSLHMKFNDSKKVGSEIYDTGNTDNNNVLLEIDVKTAEIRIMRGFNVLHMCSLNDETYSEILLVIKHNANDTKLVKLKLNGENLGGATAKYWQSPFSDLGTASNDKIVKEISFKNKEPVTVVVTTENNTLSFNVSASNSISSIKPNMKGKLFSVAFESSNKKFHVSNPEIVYGVVH